jgi:DNA-binding NarL/FixJ family response regulator
LVDDDPDVLVMLQAVLTNRTLDVVGLAGSGEDAVRVAGAIVPDVAVVDYMMPGMNGFETATRLKAVCPDCKIVLFSALDIEAEAFEYPHVDLFVRKSDVLQLEELLSEMSTHHRSGE